MSALGLNEFQIFTVKSSRVPLDGTDVVSFVCLGLFGEIGSLLSVVKKHLRDVGAFSTYGEELVEELGDSLWYFANLSHRLGLSLEEIGDAISLSDNRPARALEFSDLQTNTITGDDAALLESTLLALGASVGQVVEAVAGVMTIEREERQRLLASVLKQLVDVGAITGVTLTEAALRNMKKVASRWPSEKTYGQAYDVECPEEERLPRRLSMVFRERMVRGKLYVTQTCNGVNVGDRLTDNREQADDYRFHDVFHLAFAAILGWSPVLRALLRLKRKSDPEADENQDGARAIIIEEALATWIFTNGMLRGQFRNADALDYSLLKAIRMLVEGYEVQSRPMWQWQDAILGAFQVFRQLRSERCGIVHIDLDEHSIAFESEGEPSYG